MEWFIEHKALIILISLSYCLTGVWSLRWTCMGLIGYHNDPKGFWMLLVFIFLWWIPVGYLVAMISYGYLCSKLEKTQSSLERIQPTIDFSSLDKQRFTCSGKGGEYVVIGSMTSLGIIKPEDIGGSYYGMSIGAGTCREEKLTVNLVREDGLYFYQGLTSDDAMRIIYRDVGTGKMYHRTIADFANRMKRIN